MKIFVSILVLLGSVTLVRAQTPVVILKDGQQIVALGLKRNGDQVAITSPLAPGVQGSSTVPKPVAMIDRIVFPEPPEIRTATELMGQGKNEQAVATLDPAMAAQEPFKDIRGNWWANAAVVKLSALGNIGREKEAGELLEAVKKSGADPEMVRVAQVRFAGILSRKEDYKAALALCTAVVKESQNSQVLSEAWLNTGYAYLGLKQYELALRAYLRIPIFFAENKSLLAPAQLGIARAYVGFQDFERGIATYQGLLANYKDSAEAKVAADELKKAEKAEQDKKELKS